MYENLVKKLLSLPVVPPSGILITEQKNNGNIINVNYLANPIYKPLQCWYNCKAHVNKNGGSVVFGWSLFEKEDVLIAQHHAVWIDQDNQYYDLTENPHGKKTVFLIDERAQFDYQNLRHPANFYYISDSEYCWGEFTKDIMRPQYFIAKRKPNSNELNDINSLIKQ